MWLFKYKITYILDIIIVSYVHTHTYYTYTYVHTYNGFFSNNVKVIIDIFIFARLKGQDINQMKLIAIYV